MERTCHWCKKMIDPKRHPFVLRTVTLESGQKVAYRYHAQACYSAFKAFMDLHSFLPLDPETHEHE